MAELLMMRARMRCGSCCVPGHDLRLRLHRLRLEGRLAKIRAGDLWFSVAEAGELFTGLASPIPG